MKLITQKTILTTILILTISAIASAQKSDCDGVMMSVASGKSDGKTLTVTFTASGSVYQNGKLQKRGTKPANAEREKAIAAQFDADVKRFFVNTPSQTLSSLSLDYETLGNSTVDIAIAPNNLCRNLVAKTSDGIIVSIPINGNIQARTEGQNDPIQGVKVGLSKNPPGAIIASAVSDGEEQDGTPKWTITFDEKKATAAWQTIARNNRGLTYQKWKENLTAEFLSVKGKLFPKIKMLNSK